MLKWNDMTEQEKQVWSSAFALAHALATDNHKIDLSNRVPRLHYERCETVADDCVRDLRALNATGERYT